MAVDHRTDAADVTGVADVTRDATNRTTGWSFVQWALLVVAVVNTLWSVAGFVAEPSFAVGHDAPTAVVAGVDFNGWHAVSGLALFLPALVAATRKTWALTFSLVGAGLIIVPGIWALFSHQVGYVLHFPNNGATAVLHFVIGGVLLGIVAIQAKLDGGLKQAFGR